MCFVIVGFFLLLLLLDFFVCLFIFCFVFVFLVFGFGVFFSNNPAQREIITRICTYLWFCVPSQSNVYILGKLKHGEGRSCLRPYNGVLIKVGTDTGCLNHLIVVLSILTLCTESMA